MGGQVIAVVPHDFFGHADRGQRGAQLVGDVGDEALLELGQLVVAGDCVLEGGGHRIEGPSQGRHFVGTVHLDAHVQVSFRRLGGRVDGQAHREEETMEQGEHADRQCQDDRQGGQGEHA